MHTSRKDVWSLAAGGLGGTLSHPQPHVHARGDRPTQTTAPWGGVWPSHPRVRRGHWTQTGHSLYGLH